MIACPECGRPLAPFEITSAGMTWMHRPHCWHPDLEEVYGEEMTLEKAIQLAQWDVEGHTEGLSAAESNLAELRAINSPHHRSL